MEIIYRRADITLLMKCYLIVMIGGIGLLAVGLALAYDTLCSVVHHHHDTWLVWFVMSCACYLIIVMITLLISINKERKIYFWHVIVKIFIVIGAGLVIVLMGIYIEEYFTLKSFYTLASLAADLFEDFGIGGFNIFL